MGSIVDLPVSIDLNPENNFMAAFIDLWSNTYSPLNSAKLSCSSEVTLDACMRTIPLSLICRTSL